MSGDWFILRLWIVPFSGHEKGHPITASGTLSNIFPVRSCRDLPMIFGILACFQRLKSVNSMTFCKGILPDLSDVNARLSMKGFYLSRSIQQCCKH